MTPALLWLRIETRLRWRSLVVLGLLVAVSSAVVLTAVAGARRGATAVDRLEEGTLPAQAFVLPLDAGFDWAAVRRLPQVAAMTRFTNSTGFNVDGIPWDTFIGGGPSLDAEGMRTVERPKVLEGSLADPARADEAVVTSGFVDVYGQGVGDVLTARLYSAQQIQRLVDGFGPPPAEAEGPTQPLRIVGVVRSPWYSDDVDFPGRLMASPGLAAKYPQNVVGNSEINALVRLRHGAADLPAFRQAVAGIATKPGLVVRDTQEFAGPRRRSAVFEARALLAFGFAAAAAAGLLIWQGMARHAAVTAQRLAPLRAVGMTPLQAMAATVAAPAVVTGLAAVTGTAVAVIASSWFPLGSVRPYEPDPGPDLDVLVLLPGFLLTVLLAVAAAASALRWAPATGPRRPGRRSAVAVGLARAGLPLPVQIGSRFALEPGSGPAAVPVRSALSAVVVGVAGVVAALVISAGVADGATNPGRYGQTWDVSETVAFGEQAAPAADEVLSATAASPGVRAVNDTRSSTATAGSAALSVPLFTVHAVGPQDIDFALTTGRQVAGQGEVVLAPETAGKLGAAVGSRVGFTGTDGRRAQLRVTGIGFTPHWIDSSYDQGGWVTPATYSGLFTGDDYRFGLVAGRPGGGQEALQSEIRAKLTTVAGADMVTLDPTVAITPMKEVAGISRFPTALGGFLALLALGAGGHALASAVSRRRHELAVLRSLGATRWQVREVLATHAILLAVIGLLFGIPLGIALGRSVWRVVADFVPLQYAPPPLTGEALLTVPAFLALALLLAIWPARRAARLRVAEILRAQ